MKSMMKSAALLVLVCSSSFAYAQSGRGSQQTGSLRDVIAECATYPAGSVEAARCGAKLQCIEDGKRAQELVSCTEANLKNRLDAQRMVNESRAQARQKQEAARAAEEADKQFFDEIKKQSAPRRVSCKELFHYARARGHSLFEAAEIQQAGRANGHCD